MDALLAYDVQDLLHGHFTLANLCSADLLNY